jgi:hypothetical protein
MSAINWQLNYDIRYLMFLITPNYLSQDTEFDSRKNKCKTSILGVKVSELVSCMRATHHLLYFHIIFLETNYVYIFYTWVFLFRIRTNQKEFTKNQNLLSQLMKKQGWKPLYWNTAGRVNNVKFPAPLKAASYVEFWSHRMHFKQWIMR